MNLVPELNTAPLLGMFDPGSMFLIGLMAVLLFGGDLPKMARKFGKHYSEFQRTVGAFKKEVSSVVTDITSEINDTSPVSSKKSRSVSSSSAKSSDDEDEVETTAPKFEPPKK